MRMLGLLLLLLLPPAGKRSDTSCRRDCTGRNTRTDKPKQCIGTTVCCSTLGGGNLPRRIRRNVGKVVQWFPHLPGRISMAGRGHSHEKRQRTPLRFRLRTRRNPSPASLPFFRQSPLLLLLLLLMLLTPGNPSGTNGFPLEWPPVSQKSASCPSTGRRGRPRLWAPLQPAWLGCGLHRWFRKCRVGHAEAPVGWPLSVHWEKWK